MADPPSPPPAAATLRQRRAAAPSEDEPPAPEPGAIPESSRGAGRAEPKPMKGTFNVILGLYLLVVVAGFAALAAGAGALLYYQNPGDYFRPTVKAKESPSWFSSPDKEWVVDLGADAEKREAVVKAFKYAWRAYERDAMGSDEYHPLARKGSNLTSAGGIGYMVVDALDTMMIMGLDEEYARARRWIETKLQFDRDAEVSVFETTIRVLGGLLSAYHLASKRLHPFIPPSDAALFLNQAEDLASRLLPAFSTASGLPFSLINLHKRVGVPDRENRGLVSTAEAATLQLEFRYLSWVLGEDEFHESKSNVRPEQYWEKAERVMKVIRMARANGGLAPIFMNIDAGKFVSSDIRLGSRGDSYYEYLLKQHLQTASTEPIYRDMYTTAMNAVHRTIFVRGPLTGMLFTQEIQSKRNAQSGMSWVRVRKQDHLVCFLAGELLLGAVTVHRAAGVKKVSIPPRAEELTEEGRRDWTAGIELLETCVDTYRTPTGLSAEIVHFREAMDKSAKNGDRVRDWYIKDAKPPGNPPVYDARYILRPETIESLFVAWRLTGNPRYRAYAWRIFQSIERECRLPSGGYAGIKNILDARHHEEQVAQRGAERWEDKMETFFVSETLKYLYLMFSEARLLPLDEYVFNTEAHPFPIFDPGPRIGTGL
ncbi:alpha-1,2-Mannosidase [Mycena indigotica]|uniref:alpha-1,2-Mannosidase n=1 Tax=Mycena indigotica TaxID=2126181 RepID=A0A8H6SS67_9AGAR|nr:alpha-1,2-Mannosidase [Mycena indigotica]KAF7303417.1 alpha-1,2-Mannosidase [Mycena indigotica]